MEIYKFNQYTTYNEMAKDFIESFHSLIKEESDNQSLYKKVEQKLISDLKLDLRAIGAVGIRFAVLYPIVKELLKNMSIESIDITPDKIVLLAISAITIIYLEEKKESSGKGKLVKDSKSMLEELKMMGIGNGIVKKLIKCLKSIKNIFNIINKHIGKAVNGIIDMFAYISLLIPIMNGILAVIGKYDLNLDTLPQNFLGLGLGITTIIARHGISEIINRIKNKININKKKIMSNITDETDPQKLQILTQTSKKQEGELIKEQ
jgi:hypothetical protein